MALNWIVQPSQKESKTQLFHVTFRAFGISSECDLPNIRLLYNSVVNFIDSIDVTLSYSGYIQCLLTRLYQSYNDVSEYHILISPTYAMFMK